MAGNGLHSNLRCFTVIRHLCCRRGAGETGAHWMGKQGPQRIGGENVLVGGYNRVGVGTSFCSLHFSLLPWREGMDWGSCHLTCECFKGSPGFFWKLPFLQPPTPLHPCHFSSRRAAWSFWTTVRPRGGALWMRRGGGISFGEPVGISQEQPEQRLWREHQHLLVVWNWCNLTSTWMPPVLTKNCGSLAEPLEYIVFFWAHHPIGSINKEGIPLSLLPQQRRKGEERSWWEEKWSKGQGGEGRALFVCDCGQRKSTSYQDMCECA